MHKEEAIPPHLVVGELIRTRKEALALNTEIAILLRSFFEKNVGSVLPLKGRADYWVLTRESGDIEYHRHRPNTVQPRHYLLDGIVDMPHDGKEVTYLRLLSLPKIDGYMVALDQVDFATDAEIRQTEDRYGLPHIESASLASFDPSDWYGEASPDSQNS